jgi:hypothetical protein
MSFSPGCYFDAKVILRLTLCCVHQNELEVACAWLFLDCVFPVTRIYGLSILEGSFLEDVLFSRKGSHRCSSEPTVPRLMVG